MASQKYRKLRGNIADLLKEIDILREKCRDIEETLEFEEEMNVYKSSSQATRERIIANLPKDGVDNNLSLPPGAPESEDDDQDDDSSIGEISEHKITENLFCEDSYSHCHFFDTESWDTVSGIERLALASGVMTLDEILTVGRCYQYLYVEIPGYSRQRIAVGKRFEEEVHLKFLKKICKDKIAALPQDSLQEFSTLEKWCETCSTIPEGYTPFEGSIMKTGVCYKSVGVWIPKKYITYLAMLCMVDDGVCYSFVCEWGCPLGGDCDECRRR